LRTLIFEFTSIRRSAANSWQEGDFSERKHNHNVKKFNFIHML